MALLVIIEFALAAAILLAGLTRWQIQKRHSFLKPAIHHAALLRHVISKAFTCIMPHNFRLGSGGPGAFQRAARVKCFDRIQLQRPHVPGDAVVRIVTAEHLVEAVGLLPDR